MPGNDSTNNRLSEAQRNNSFRSDSENNIRNASLSGAGRNSEESGLYSSPKRTGITDQSPTESIKSKITDGLKNIKGEEDSINNKINSNINEINSRNASPSNLKSSAPKSTNGGLTPKQQLAKKGIEIAAKHINPALGAAVKSKTGQRVLNAVLQKKNLFTSPLGVASIIPNPLKPEDKENINQDGKNDENRFGSVSVTISKRVKTLLIPITAACAVVVFGCCIIMVAAHAYNSILGMDLSWQISMDDPIFGNLASNVNAGANKFKIKSNVKTNPGDAVKYTTQDERIEWLYDGKGVPQTEEENNKYLETFEVEILDGDGNPTTMEITMHTKLKTEVQEIFKEMKEAGFKIHGGDVSFRPWSYGDNGYQGAFYWSAHSYGHAFDVNPIENCYMPSSGSACTVGNLYSPGVNEYSVTEEIVNIWKDHGFYWGGDWTAPIDYMHFSYFDH